MSNVDLNSKNTISPISGASLGRRVALPTDLQFESVIKKPLVIPCEKEHPWLDVIRTADQTRAVELLAEICMQAPDKSILRWAGGCKGFDANQVERLFAYVAQGSISEDGERSFKGAVGSGGTQDYNKDGAESAMICQVPYYMARLSPCIAWGSTPQTFRLRLDANDGSIIVSKYGAHLDSRGHLNVLTQANNGAVQNWDGDVRWYVNAMKTLEKRNFKTAIAVVNGGDVTLDEALLGLSRGIPVIVVDGTGRTADSLAQAFREGKIAALYNQEASMRGIVTAEDPIPNEEQIKRLIHIVNINDPKQLSATLDKLGLLS